MDLEDSSEGVFAFASLKTLPCTEKNGVLGGLLRLGIHVQIAK